MKRKPTKKEVREDSILFAAKMAMQGKPMSDKSVDAAINEIRTRRYTGVIPKEEHIGLRLAKAVMEENVRRKKRKKFLSRLSICSGITAFAGMIVLIFVLCFVIPNTNSEDWKDYLSVTIIDYDALKKEETISVKNLNKEKNGHFYYLEGLNPVETRLFYYKKNRILIEEEYIFNGITCILYIINTNTQVNHLLIELDYPVFYESGKLKIRYESYNNSQYCKFLSDYQYFLKIQSPDSTTFEPIVTLLSNN